MRILVVEDEEALARGLRFNFEHEGYETTVVGDGRTALSVFRKNPTAIDLVVLDLMLPGMSGYEICRAIREVDTHIPILVLSARSLSEDRTQAFDCGTDQYLTKPFALPELLSRVRNLIQRHRPLRNPENGAAGDDGASVYTFGDILVNFAKFEVTVGGQRHNLTTMEMQLLRYFIEHEGDVLSRSQLLGDVWGESSEYTSRTIDNFVMRLRRIIESNPSSPRHILSVRGTGYRFVAEPASATDELAEG